MSAISKSMHSIIFVKGSGLTEVRKNTYDDWLLVPTSKPVIPFPTVKSSLFEIAGTDGGGDVTEALAGRVLFGFRSLSLDFAIEGYTTRSNWYTLLSDIATFLHGQRLKMILEDDDLYYYTGRFTINETKTGEYLNQISINATLDPYKILISDETVKSL